MSARLARKSGVDADDLFQIATLAVRKALRAGSFAGPHNPRTLMATVAVRAAIDYAIAQRRYARTRAASGWRIGGGLRRRSRTPSRPAWATATASPPTRPTGSTGCSISPGPRTGDMLTRAFKDGESLRDIAERFGVSRNRVNQRIAASVARIRKQRQPKLAS